MDVASLRIAIQTGDIKKAEQELGKLESASNKTEKATDSLNLKTAALGVSIVALGVGFITLIKRNIDLADSTLKAAQAAGVSVETFSKFSYVADLAGVSTQELSMSFAQLSNSMSTNDYSFKRIGVSIKDASGKLKDSEVVIGDIADRFAELPDGAEKTAIAMDLFGRGGSKLIPFLNQGSAGIKELTAEAERLGIVLDTKTAMAAEQFNDNLTRANAAIGSVGRRVTADLLPAIVEFSNLLVDLSKNEAALSTATEILNGTLGIAKTVFQTIAVVGSDVGFVFLSVGREIGAFSAQIAALGRGDFEGFKAISEAVKADGERARAELDKFQQRIMSIGENGGASIEVKTKTGKVGASKEELEIAKKRAEELADAEGQINTAKNAELVAAAEEADKANFKSAEDLAKAQEQENKKEHEQVTAFTWQEAERKIQEDYRVAEEDAKTKVKALEEWKAANKKASEELRKDVQGALMRSFEKGGDLITNFGQALGSVVYSRLLTSITEALASKALTSFGSNDAGGSGINFGTLASLFGGGGASSIPIDGYEGGGFTGSGSRSGGMDGKGGFMAMLHPNETVVDHTKGQSSGGVVFAPVINVDARSDRADIMRTITQAVQNGQAQLVDTLSRQRRLA